MKKHVGLALIAAVSIAFALEAEAQSRAPQSESVPTWYAVGLAAAIQDPTPGIAASVRGLPRWFEAFAQAGDAEQRRTLHDTLVKLASSNDSDVQQFAADALSAFLLGNPEWGQNLLDTLVKLAASNDRHVQRSAAAALGALNARDPGQRQTVLDTLIKLSDINDSDVQRSAAAALGAVGSDDPGQHRTVLDALIKLATNGAISVKQFALAALDTIAARDPEQRRTVLDTLIKLAASNDRYVQQSAAAALGAFAPSDPGQRRIVLDTLLRLAADDDVAVQRSAAAALGGLKPGSPEQRRLLLDSLIKLANNIDSDVQQSAAAGLGALDPVDPEQGRIVLDTLIKFADSWDPSVRRSAATAFGALDPSDPERRRIVLKTLVKLGKVYNDSDTQQSAALALAAIAARDQEQHQIVFGTLIRLAASDNRYDQRAAAAGLGAFDPGDLEQRRFVLATLIKLAIVGDDPPASAAVHALGAIAARNPELRTTALDTLVSLAVSSNVHINVQRSAAATLGAFKPGDPEQRHIVLDTLVKLADSGDGDVQRSAAVSLGAIKLDDREQRRVVLDTLVKLADIGDGDVQRSAAVSLGAIKLDDREQRRVVLDTLLKLATDRYVQKSAATALLRSGPLDAEHIANLLARLYRDNPREIPKWRAIGWAFLGKWPGYEPGPTLLTFIGHAGTIPPERFPKNPTDAAEVLRVFAKFWPADSNLQEMRHEIALRTGDIIRNACPAAASPDSASRTLPALTEGVLREWRRTRTWIGSWFGGEDSMRCWTSKDRAALVSLRDKFGADKTLRAQRRELDDHLAADGAAPVIGESMLTVGAWALFWTGFLVLFPHSRRMRAFYLFNEKARGALSLWFVPALMTLLPFVRRRMLRPFRDDLLADARLGALDERAWFVGLRVRDRTGKVRVIENAIPHVRGTQLLIGESGLGKSTYLRLLAKRSRRTAVFLNARSCDKGVEEAIVQRVNEFQSASFFRALIYSGDLTVLIDGLNEVNAEIRAGIVAFANRAGNGNILIATQPIEGIGTERSPLTRATAYELLPLARDEIAQFLKTRPARDDVASSVRGQEYDLAVERFLSEALDGDAETDQERVLKERETATLVLSNPMDLTYAGELIAAGQLPRPSELVSQAYALAHNRYRMLYDRDFPTLAIAQKGVEIRRTDRNWLQPDEFATEQGVLEEFKLIVPRSMNETRDKEVIIRRFRHDKVMDVMIKPAFEQDTALQLELLDDPRFRGVYLLFAQTADRELAGRLRDLLVSHAAQTGDNGLSNEFVRRFDLGPRKVKREAKRRTSH